MAHYLVITFTAGLVPVLIVGLFSWRFVRSFYSFRFRDVFLVASVQSSINGCFRINTVFNGSVSKSFLCNWCV